LLFHRLREADARGRKTRSDDDNRTVSLLISGNCPIRMVRRAGVDHGEQGCEGVPPRPAFGLMQVDGAGKVRKPGGDVDDLAADDRGPRLRA
jgi:hypothetical protein